MRFWLVCCAFLAGCGTWSKPGSTEAEFYQDKGQCQAQSYANFPPMMARSGGYQGPAQTNCTTTPVNGTLQTHCTTAPGMSMPGVQTDQNTVARAVAFEACMRGKGWTLSVR